MKNPATTNERDQWNTFTRKLKKLIDEKGSYPVTLRDGRVFDVVWFIDPWDSQYQHFRFKDDSRDIYLIWDNCGRSVTSSRFDIVSML